MSDALTARQRSRGLLALMSSTVVSLSGQFMVTPLLVFLLSERQVPVSIIGLFSASSWLGILCTTPWAAQIVARIGYRQALLVSLALPCFTLSGIALTDDIRLWAGLNFIGGAAMSLRWIVGEACVAELAPAHRRGRIVGLYQTLLGASFVLAPALLAWLGPTHPLAPWTAVAALALGVVLTLFVPRLPVALDQSAHAGLKGLWLAAKGMPVVVMAGMFGGFFEIGIASLLPAYGLAVGFGAGAAALLVSASGLGSSLVMLPLGEATDRYSGRAVMHACAGVTLVAALVFPLAASWLWLAWPLAFLWGGAGGALYTLAMIGLGHAHRGRALINATSVLVLSYTLGGMSGPVISGYAIELSPRYALPAAFALAAALGWFGMARGRWPDKSGGR